MCLRSIEHPKILDIVKRFKGHGLTFDQFEEVFNICKSQNHSPTDEVSSSAMQISINLNNCYFCYSSQKVLLCLMWMEKVLFR